MSDADVSAQIVADPLAALPAELIERLLKLFAVLENNGAVIACPRKGRDDVFRLRYRHYTGGGPRRQGSVLIRGQAAAAAVRGLLKQWQAQRQARQQAEREVERARRAALRQEKKELSEQRKKVMELGGGGRRRRQRNAREFDQAAAEGGISEFIYHFNQPYLRPNRRPGRPRRGALKLEL